jgi:hypothetical protein
MKRLLIPLILLLLLAGGGYAGWIYGKPMLEKMQAERAKAAAAPLYVSMDPLVVPVIENNVVTHHLTISISLEVAGQAASEKLREGMPRIVDAFNSELYGLLAIRFVREGGLELPLVKKRLLVAGERELGPGVVTDVLIRGVDRGKGQQAAQG